MDRPAERRRVAGDLRPSTPHEHPLFVPVIGRPLSPRGEEGGGVQRESRKGKVPAAPGSRPSCSAIDVYCCLQRCDEGRREREVCNCYRNRYPLPLSGSVIAARKGVGQMKGGGQKWDNV